MNGYVHAYNGTDDIASGWGRFRHTATNEVLDELEKALPLTTFDTGESYGYSTSDDFFQDQDNFEFSTGGDIFPGDTWKCDAYLRLQAAIGHLVDTWVASDYNEFTYRDNLNQR